MATNKKAEPKKKSSTTAKVTKKKSAPEIKKPEPEKKESAKKLVRIKLIAELFGVGERRIQQLSEEGIIKPVGGKDKDGYQYDFAVSIVAIGRYYRERADNRKSNESKDLEGAKLEAMKIKIEKDLLELDELKKDLHRSADIERVVGAALSRLRINLLAIPLGVAPLVRDKSNVNEIAEIISERISRALNETATLDIDKMLIEEEGTDTE